MAETAALLVEHRLPEVPWHQWVLSFEGPMAMRLDYGVSLPPRPTAPSRASKLCCALGLRAPERHQVAPDRQRSETGAYGGADEPVPEAKHLALFVPHGHLELPSTTILLETQLRDAAPSRLSWMTLLARVFRIDISVCAQCSGPMKVTRFVTTPEDIAAERSASGPLLAAYTAGPLPDDPAPPRPAVLLRPGFFTRAPGPASAGWDGRAVVLRPRTARVLRGARVALVTERREAQPRFHGAGHGTNDPHRALAALAHRDGAASRS